MQLPNQPPLIDKKVKLYSFIPYTNSNRARKRKECGYKLKGGKIEWVDAHTHTMILDPNGSPAPFRTTVKPRTSKYVRHIGNKQLAKFTR